jgi:hypothetical protein
MKSKDPLKTTSQYFFIISGYLSIRMIEPIRTCVCVGKDMRSVLTCQSEFATGVVDQALRPGALHARTGLLDAALKPCAYFPDSGINIQPNA